MKLELSLFRFDKNSDYLPFYTKHFFKIENEKTLLDILNTINEEDKFGFEANVDFDVVVNGRYLKVSEDIQAIVNEFGKDLTIEPISIRRAYKDLLINDDDFQQRLSILDKVTNEQDKKEYLKLKPYYYASDTLNHNADYIGDALLLLASDLIDKHKEFEDEILLTLSQFDIGASYHTSLANRIFNFDFGIEDKIVELQKTLKLFEDIDKQNFRINNTLILDFGKLEENVEVKHDFKDFNIAYYANDSISQTDILLEKTQAKILNLDTLNLDLARNTFNKSNEITFRVATTIILDAFDNNADFLLVDNDEDFYIFDYNRKALEKCSGREIILPVIHLNEFARLISGNHAEANKTLIKHQINPEII
jgi:succinate dehydrogenase/fumarate reductase-like Fe-S protein